MAAVLPYFISGPPLFNSSSLSSSTKALQSVIKGNPFPEVMLPMVDVRDAATAHIIEILDPFLLANNGRYLISTESLWFS